MVSPKIRRDLYDIRVSDLGVVRNIDAGGQLRQTVDGYMAEVGQVKVVFQV